MLKVNKINLFKRLIKNSYTRSIILSKLTTAINRNSFVYEIEQLAHELNFDIKVMLINRNRFSAEFIFNEIPEDVYESITNSFQYWHLQEQRNIFKNIMEENIPR